MKIQWYSCEKFGGWLIRIKHQVATLGYPQTRRAGFKTNSISVCIHCNTRGSKTTDMKTLRFGSVAPSGCVEGGGGALACLWLLALGRRVVGEMRISALPCCASAPAIKAGDFDTLSNEVFHKQKKLVDEYWGSSGQMPLACSRSSSYNVTSSSESYLHTIPCM
eukprot:3771018-Pleurochrysis_carterae.AAC.1